MSRTPSALRLSRETADRCRLPQPAIAASRELPAGSGAELLQAAREAFTAGLHVTGVLGAVIFLGQAALVLALRTAAGTTPAARRGLREATSP